MSWSLAIDAPLSESLLEFSRALQVAGVPHRISEARGVQQLWVADEETADYVRRLYQAYQRNPESIQASLETAYVARTPASNFSWSQIKRTPALFALIVATLLVAAWTQLGEALQPLSWLTFAPFVVSGDYIYFASLEFGLQEGQWWRLLSPMLIHFGWLHLAMNLVWVWELGRRIERQQGSVFFIVLCLVAALVSNYSQYLASGPSLFGGLSGVLYALLGYCWIYQRLRPVAAYNLPKGVVIMMLIWLLVCLSGLVTVLGFGQIANAAHVGGLVLGCVAGAGCGLYARKIKKLNESDR